MSPASTSYEDIFATLRRLNLPYQDFEQQYLRTVFNIVARNVDDHNKNFSFCMNRNGEWRLSPAYDLTYSVDLTAPAYSNRHSLTVNAKNEDITRSDLEKIGANNDIQDYNTLIDKVIDAVSNFENYAKDLNINIELIANIKGDLNILFHK